MYVFIFQVSQLYDVVQKWDAMSTAVPQVVQRLVAVKELHEQGNAREQEVVHKGADHAVHPHRHHWFSLHTITLYECSGVE